VKFEHYVWEKKKREVCFLARKQLSIKKTHFQVKVVCKEAHELKNSHGKEKSTRFEVTTGVKSEKTCQFNVLAR